MSTTAASNGHAETEPAADRLARVSKAAERATVDATAKVLACIAALDAASAAVETQEALADEVAALHREVLADVSKGLAAAAKKKR